MTIIRDGFQNADLDVPVVLPTLNLDFANSQSLDERITFSRGSIGTFVNKNGLIETAPANVPRFDYDPISGECKGLLIEESRQNLFTYSDDFSNAFWTKTNSLVQTNIVTSPNGNITANKLIENNQIGVHRFFNNTTSILASTTYTLSVFAKAAERSRLTLEFRDSIGVLSQVTFNLITGTFTSTIGTQHSIINVGNGWYRLILSATTSASHSGAGTYLFLINNNSGTTYSGDETSGIYIWGAQLEAGAFPTSYIPTSGSTVTRSADLASMTGTNFLSWYNQSEGTFYISGNAPYVFQRSFGASIFNKSSFADSRITMRMGNTFIRAGADQFAVFPQATKNDWKLSFSLKQNDTFFVLDGSRLAADKNVILPTNLDTLEFGKVENVSSTLFLNGTIKKLAYYPKALSTTQLQYLTQ